MDATKGLNNPSKECNGTQHVRKEPLVSAKDFFRGRSLFTSLPSLCMRLMLFDRSPQTLNPEFLPAPSGFPKGSLKEERKKEGIEGAVRSASVSNPQGRRFPIQTHRHTDKRTDRQRVGREFLSTVYVAVPS